MYLQIRVRAVTFVDGSIRETQIVGSTFPEIAMAKKSDDFAELLTKYTLSFHENSPMGTRLSREHILHFPSVSEKATKWGGFSAWPYKKVGPVSVIGRAR